jgi:hypothetical protein
VQDGGKLTRVVAAVERVLAMRVVAAARVVVAARVVGRVARVVAARVVGRVARVVAARVLAVRVVWTRRVVCTRVVAWWHGW